MRKTIFVALTVVGLLAAASAISGPGSALAYGHADHPLAQIEFSGNCNNPGFFLCDPEILGTGVGIKAATEIEMAAALERARANTQSYTIIQVMLDRNDHSPALLRLTARLAERVTKKSP